MERVLATARAFLAACSLFAIYLDATEPSAYAPFAYTLLVLYVFYSLALLGWLRYRPPAFAGLALGVHGVDILWAAFITLFTAGPNSPFFLFFVFVLLAAAYRWGFRETLTTAFIAVALLLTEITFVTSGAYGAGFLDGQFELNRSVMRAVYLLLLGWLLGYLAEEEKRIRAESAVAARLLSGIQASTGFRGALREVFGELLHLFQVPHALLAVKESKTGRVFLWQARRGPPLPSLALELSEIAPSRSHTYFFSAPAQSWLLHRAKDDSWQAAALDLQGHLGRGLAFLPSADFLSAHSFRSLLCVSTAFGEEWNARFFLFDPRHPLAPEAQLNFLHVLVRQISPALYNVYLLRRLRARATAMERARVARELHDGAIQSLLALEMQMDVLRRKTAGNAPDVGDELARLQQLLRNEVLSLRELMEQLRPLDLDPHQLLDFLADLVERFRRETGIAASFVCELDEAPLPPRVSTELVRIVQEALVNVRKHSGAENVVVRFSAGDGHWTLVVDDDGCGFPFEGRLSRDQLDTARLGPLVIKERARSIAAELTVESTPGQGARLEVRLPQTSHG